MHFALPPRKSSFPPPYARASAHNSPIYRRRQIQYLAYIILGILTVYLIYGFLSPDAPLVQDGVREDASILIVTVLDESSMNNEYISMIKKNRDDYALRHGYRNFYASVSTYAALSNPSPASWSLIPALRDALTQYPHIDYIWSLTPHAVITKPDVSLHEHIFSRLPDLMMKDIAVVPPDSVIHTFSHLKPAQIHLILTQDTYNVAHTSFILRNTRAIPTMTGQPRDTWSQYFLDAWFDPLYRAYAFQKAENHALEHIIQWHPTILAKLAIVKQRMLNSYSPESLAGESSSKKDGMWQAGDLVVNFKACAEQKGRDCGEDMRKYITIWEEAVAKIDGKTVLQ